MEEVENERFREIEPSHQNRQAVVYLRQSSPKQVYSIARARVNQRALRDGC